MPDNSGEITELEITTNAKINNCSWIDSETKWVQITVEPARLDEITRSVKVSV
jgi:hypothetical protein